ncbi:hypothetical protein NQZ79_g3777 [Umbelopsis isabellina]|nr:hypothetical protein NQZ79_g3777 [Umbelopsis isabellina]
MSALTDSHQTPKAATDEQPPRQISFDTSIVQPRFATNLLRRRATDITPLSPSAISKMVLKTNPVPQPLKPTLHRSESQRTKPAQPLRSTKVSQKLVLFPNADDPAVHEDVEYQDGGSNQVPLDTHVSGSRTIAERMTKDQRDFANLPRVSAYCTAEAYDMKQLGEFLRHQHYVSPRLYDECLYARYHFPLQTLRPGGRRNATNVRVRSASWRRLGSYDSSNVLDQSQNLDHYDYTYEEEHPAQDANAEAYPGPYPTPIHDHEDTSRFEAQKLPEFDISEANEGLEYQHQREDTSSTAYDYNYTFSSNKYAVSPSEYRTSATEPDSNIDIYSNPTGEAADSSKANDWSNDPETPKASPDPHNEAPMPMTPQTPSFSSHFNGGELFVFDYGVIVLWNFSRAEEILLLEDLTPFGVRPLKDNPQDIEEMQIEEMHFQYDTSQVQPRIFNDMITLKSGNHMIKLTISHGVSQSAVLARFEDMMDSTIKDTKHIPKELAQTGRLRMDRTEITQISGYLFKLRMDVNLVSNILDTPEIFWSEPSLQSLYKAIRDGRNEKVHFDKISSRISRLAAGLDERYVDPAKIAQKVVTGMYQGITTIELDNLTAETAAYMTTTHPDYAILAARIAVSNLHKETDKDFSAVVDQLYNYMHPIQKCHVPLVSKDLYDVVMANADRVNNAIDYERDYDYNFFGFKTLEKSYLMRSNGKVIERPQHLLMRVALGIHGTDIDAAIETYDLMSKRYFTHATPTLFNAGTPKPQMSSCFLVQMKDDSIEGIYDTLTTCARISKASGGVGVSFQKIRASGSYIAGTNGTSNGIVPMLRVFNDTARFVNQGGGKRNGSFAMYTEPWHSDIFDFLDLRKNSGKEELRARDLFLGLWIPDLFMKRVKQDADWSLFCPNEALRLNETYGKEFEELYEMYERQGKARKVISAQKLWFSILDAQIETGMPYILYKDACNEKSNQKNLGTISSSNLCTEIIEYTAPDEVAVCNLASLALPKFVNFEKQEFDFQTLHDIAKVVTKNLNKVIDANYYPVPEAKKSNFRHRPVGLGVQGLADAFLLLRYPFDSPEAKQLNTDIFETIYHAALEASCEMAVKDGPYETYEGSPVSQGILQPDMWGVKPSDRWDWDTLRQSIAKHGVRNSLLVAPMPTASTSQILGNNECFEPYTSNIYTRRVMSGEFQVVNQHLLKDLIERGLWNERIKNMIIAHNGSVQQVPEIPDDLKKLYKTVWELSQRVIIDMAADRGAFVDQSQSLNLFMAEPTSGKLTSMHFYSWQKGLKTGMYYLRSRPAVDAIKVNYAILIDAYFTVDQNALKNLSVAEQNSNEENLAAMQCSLDNRDACMSCSG